jgi:uncharacterized protein involved in outer membrane biogenesis
MIAARRIGRWLLYGLGACIVLVVLVRVGLGVYLGSSAGRAMVARQISASIGMPVEVTQVRVGLFTSSIGLRVFDPAAPDPSKAEVFSVASARANVSLFGFATGRTLPSEVKLNGANLTLHVAADGKVLTTLPKAPSGGGPTTVPAITLMDGHITIRQDGRPEFTLQNLNLAVEPAGSHVKLSGSLDDPQWSKWTISGDVVRDSKSGTIEVTAPDAPLTMDRLASIPFVPAEVWQHIRPDGRGAISARLWTDSVGAVHYCVSVTPHAAALTLPDANVTLSNTSGTATVSGSNVTLSGTSAELADGTVTADGSCDFGAEPKVARVKVSADKLDIQKLPSEWHLPKDFAGKLKGVADLTLRISASGHIEPEGGGEGVITDVKVLDFPGDDIPIHLRRSGNRYEFQQPKNGKEGRVKPWGATPKPGTGHIRPVRAAVPCAAPGQDKKPADPPAKDPPAKTQPPTTLDATIRLRDIDIAELLKKLNIKLDYKISGKVTAEAAVTVPLASATSQTAYEFSGKVSSPALTLEGLVIRDLSAHMTYQNGKFTLTDLSGKIDQPTKGVLPPGAFHGTLSAMTSPPGDVTADLTVTNIPLGEVLKALPGFTVPIGGTVGGKVSMKAPFAKLSDPGEWSGSGSLTSSELVIAGRSAKDIRLAVTVAKGVAALKEATVNLEGIPISASATLALSGKYPFTATVRTTGTDVTDLRKLVPEAEIPAPVKGVLETETIVKGTAVPLAYTASGTIKANKLTLASSPANHIEATWALTPEKFTVSSLKAEVFGGTVSGSADVPLVPEKGGTFDVTIKTLDAGVAAELVPDFPVKIAGKVSGKIGGTIPPKQAGQARVGDLDVEISAPKLTVQGIPADSLAGKATIRNGVLEYGLEGKTLGGSFEVKGRYPGQKKEAPKPGGPGRGSVRIQGVDLSRIGPEIGLRSLDPLRGRLDLDFEFENDLSAGTGRIRLTRLRWGDAELARELTGALVLRDGALRLTDFVGSVAGGELRVRARVALRTPERNFFTVSLDGADAKKLLAPVTDPAGLIDGPITFVVHGRLGREVQGSGTLSLARGTVSGVPVADLHVPFEFSTAPGGYGQFSVRDASVSAGTGRARADLTADWGTEARLEGQIRFTDLPLRTLAPELGENVFLGNGRLTGRFDLKGSNVRSLDDLTGTLVARLNNTSVKELPVLRQAAPFLNPAGVVKPFNAGDVRVTLAKGVFRVQRLALANPTAQVFADGTISTTGRVDLSVVAHTGTIGPESPALRLFGLRLPTVGPIPLSLIQNVSDFLSNRTVRLTVTGTVNNPIVRVNVGALLSEEAVRFLLGKYVLPADAAGALGLGYGLGSSGMKK